MAPQTSIPLAANILGTIGTICWCVQLVPQIWYNWRRKNTDGLPGIMCFLWALTAPAFGAYAIVQNLNIPVQIQPHIMGALCLVCWAQTLYYHNKWSKTTATLAGFSVAAIFGAVEAPLIYFVRRIYQRGVEWPITVIGIIAAVILAIGLLPPYYELWKRGGRVVGINFIFLTIDFSGAFFSLLSLSAQNSFDMFGGILYIICLVLEVGIFTSQGIWLYRTRKVRKAAKEAGMTYDQFVDVTTEKAIIEDSPPPSRDSNLDTLQSTPLPTETLPTTPEHCACRNPTTGIIIMEPSRTHVDLEKGTIVIVTENQKD